MATTLSTTVYEYAPQSDSGFVVGSVSSDKVGFYGKVPAAQRAYTANLLTTAVVTSASFGTLQVAQLQEVINVLKDIGICASA